MNSEERNSRHLTAEDISQWLVEGPDMSAAEHVRYCSACEAKLSEAQAPLAAFRGALVEWSEAQAGQNLLVHASKARNEPQSGSRFWIPAAVFALALLLLTGYAKIPALLHGKPSGQTAVATEPPANNSDEALLAQVDSEVSETVPDSMAPLTDLVGWDSNEESSSHSLTTEKHGTHTSSMRPGITKAPHDVAD